MEPMADKRKDELQKQCKTFNRPDLGVQRATHIISHISLHLLIVLPCFEFASLDSRLSSTKFIYSSGS